MGYRLHLYIILSTFRSQIVALICFSQVKICSLKLFNSFKIGLLEPHLQALKTFTHCSCFIPLKAIYDTIDHLTGKTGQLADAMRLVMAADGWTWTERKMDAAALWFKWGESNLRVQMNNFREWIRIRVNGWLIWGLLKNVVDTEVAPQWTPPPPYMWVHRRL